MRLLVVVDAQNLWGSVRGKYGPDARIDYLKLRKLAKGENNYTDIRYRAYIGGVRPESGSSFARVLRALGYQVVAIGAKTPNISSSNWDSGIIVDVLGEIDTFDHLTLVTGDGDFLPLVAKLKESGKLVRLVTIPHTANPRLAAACDEVRLIDEKYVMRKKHESGV